MHSPPSHDLRSLIPLSSQVGGHKGVLASEDGSLVFKPALPLELKFYEELNLNSSLARIRPFIPQYYGTLKLEGILEQSSIASGDPGTKLKVTPLDKADKYTD
jgi:inositol-polyphosphate multikinase